MGIDGPFSEFGFRYYLAAVQTGSPRNAVDAFSLPGWAIWLGLFAAVVAAAASLGMFLLSWFRDRAHGDGEVYVALYENPLMEVEPSGGGDSVALAGLHVEGSARREVQAR